MGNPGEDYEAIVLRAVSGWIARAPSTLEHALRACRGAFPSFVIELAKRAGVDLPQSPPSSQQLETIDPIDSFPGNPVLCSWYFTNKTAAALANLYDYDRKHIAFAGCPKLFSYFSANAIGKSRVLFDVDTSVIELLRKSGVPDSMVCYDIASPVPIQWRDAFDIVFFDPPWYADDYAIWITRATALARHNGFIGFSLLPELTRPTAAAERTAILALVRTIDSEAILISDALRYSIPTFERSQLDRAGLTGLQSWKSADLVVLRNVASSETPTSLPPSTNAEWSDIVLSTIRVFVNNRLTSGKQLLAVPPGGAYLTSPSRREVTRQAANVLTSDGRAFMTNDPTRLVAILQSLSHSHPDQDLAHHPDIDESSRNTIAMLLSKNDFESEKG